MENVRTAKQRATEIRRWGYLCLGLLGTLFVGIIYAWSILNAPLAETFGWDVSKLAVTYTISIGFFCAGSLLAGAACKKIGSRLVILASALCLCGGFIWTARASGSITMLYISYGVLVGSGSGMAYNVLISDVCAWFPDKKGVASGVLLMGYGMSAMLIGKTLGSLFTRSEFDWRQIFTSLGIIILLVLLLCSLILRRPGADDALPARRESAKIKKRKEESPAKEYTFAETMRQPSFWIYYLYGLLATATGSTVIGLARNLALSVGATVAFATTLAGLLSACNGVGRILSGMIFDVWGRRYGMRFFSCLTVLAALTMLMTVLTNSLILAGIGFCITGISYGAVPTLNPVFLLSMYGNKDFPLNYGVTNTKGLFASFAATITGAIVAKTGSYVIPFIMLLGMAIVALGLSELLNRDE